MTRSHPPARAARRRARARGSTTSAGAGSPAASWPRGSTAASAASRRTRRSSRRRSARGADYDEQFGDLDQRRHVGHRRLLGPRHHRHRGRARAPAPGLRRAATASTATCRSRSPPTSPATPPAPSTAARELHEAHRRAEPLREDPRHRRGRAADPGDDRRGPQHQRHAHLQPRPLRRGDGGLPRRPRGRPTATSAGSPAWPASSSRRVDTEVDRRLEEIGTDDGPRRCGARPRWPRPSSPTSCSSSTFQGPRWEALVARGARVQRPLWASTSTKNPALPRHALRRRADRPRHRQHDARGRPSRRSSTTAPSPAPSTPTPTPPRPRSTRWPRSASTSTTSPRCSRSRAWRPSPSRSTS